MNTATIKRLLILLSSSGKIELAQLYQLIQAAESCYCLKNTKGQYELGAILKTFPKPLSFIGDYHQVAHLYKQGHKDKALEILDLVRNFAPREYQGKSLLTVGGIHQLEGDYDEAMKVRLVASKSETLSVVLDAALGIAALLGARGKHANAVEYLEGILPLASKLGPVPLYFDLLNSYAVELGEQGKTDEALKVIKPVVSSPYVSYYPNWLETQQEIEGKSKRSIVSFNSSNVVEFPMSDKVRIEQPAREPQESPCSDYIESEFRLNEKIEDWVYGKTEPDDLGALMLALAESEDEGERDIIIDRVMQTTFVHTEEGREARDKWESKLLSKMKK